MKPLVTFPDPEALIVGYYTDAFADRTEPYAPATVTTGFPAEALFDTTTHLQVELEAGNAADYPVTERAQVRVTCYAAPGHRSDVKRLATLAQGLLYVHPGDEAVAGTSPLVGRSDVIADPDTHNLMVWFTFRVNLKATQLTA